MIAFLDGQDKAKEGPLGCVGHCMSGPFAMTVAAKYSRMKAAAALYGVDMVTDKPDSPHKLAGRSRASSTSASPGTTRPCRRRTPPGARRSAEGRRHALSDGDVRRTRITASASRTGRTTTPAAAEKCWDTLFDLWDRNLK